MLTLVIHRCPYCGQGYPTLWTRCKCGARQCSCGTCQEIFWTQERNPFCPYCTVQTMHRLERYLQRHPEKIHAS